MKVGMDDRWGQDQGQQVIFIEILSGGFLLHYRHKTCGGMTFSIVFDLDFDPTLGSGSNR